MGCRLSLLITIFAAFLAGIMLASLLSPLSQRVAAVARRPGGVSAEAQTPAEEPERKTAGTADHGAIRLSDSEIETAGITLAALQGKTITRCIVVPGTVVLDTDASPMLPPGFRVVSPSCARRSVMSSPVARS